MPRCEESQHAYNVLRRVKRACTKVDPRIPEPHEGDRYLWEGPVIDIGYWRSVPDEQYPDASRLIYDDLLVPYKEQKAKLRELALLLTDKGLPVIYADQDSGTFWPCIEVALDLPFHNAVMARVAGQIYEYGEEAMAPVSQKLRLHIVGANGHENASL